jgi:hypothetical protein
MFAEAIKGGIENFIGGIILSGSTHGVSLHTLSGRLSLTGWLAGWLASQLRCQYYD